MTFTNWLTHSFVTRGFWGDEAWTIGISRLHLSEIIKITSQDFHPPFYYFLVHFLGINFGWGELTIRLLSTAFFILALISTYYFTKLIWKKSSHSSQSKLAPYLTSLLILGSPILLRYAFEARSYGLLAFESVFSAYVFWKAKDESSKHYLWRTTYFILGVIMVYTHYYAWFILASHAVYLLISQRSRILPMLTSALGILLAQLPWLPTLFHQVGSVKQSYWIGAINSRTHLEFFLRVTGGDFTTKWQAPLALIFAGVILIDFIYRIYRHQLTKIYIFLLSWLLTPILIPTFVSLAFMPIFFYRYLIFSAIPLSLILVKAISRLKPTPLIIITLVIFSLQLKVDNHLLNQQPTGVKELLPQLPKQEQLALNNEPIYTVLPTFAEVMYYLHPNYHIVILPEGLVQFSGKSLLDAYVKLGLTQIKQPPTSTPYWFINADKQLEYRQPQPE